MPWQKGQSGNPGGRPSRKPITEALVKALAKRVRKGGPTQAEEAAAQLVRLFLAGDIAAGRLVMNYVDGMPTQPLEHSGPDGQAFTLTIVRPHGASDPAD